MLVQMAEYTLHEFYSQGPGETKCKCNSFCSVMHTWDNIPIDYFSWKRIFFPT